jgi:hypothetical protein
MALFLCWSVVFSCVGLFMGSRRHMDALDEIGGVLMEFRNSNIGSSELQVSTNVSSLAMKSRGSPSRKKVSSSSWEKSSLAQTEIQAWQKEHGWHDLWVA